jgi:hypothetical protein
VLAVLEGADGVDGGVGDLDEEAGGVDDAGRDAQEAVGFTPMPRVEIGRSGGGGD